MRILDVDSDQVVTQAQMYLTPSEAEQLIEDLSMLLVEPDTAKHHHLISENGGCEMSYSLITPRKLEKIASYTEREQRLLLKNK